MSGPYPLPLYRWYLRGWENQGSMSGAFGDDEYPDLDLMVEALHDEEAPRHDDVAHRRPTRGENRNVRVA